MIFGISSVSRDQPYGSRIITEKVLTGSRWHNAYSINIETPSDLYALMKEVGELILTFDDDGKPHIRIYDGFQE